MGFVEWLIIIAGAAALLSLALGLSLWWAAESVSEVMARSQERVNLVTQQLLATMQADTQRTLTAIDHNGKRGQEILAGVNQAVARLAQMVERFDQRAEKRHRDLKGRSPGRA